VPASDPSEADARALLAAPPRPPLDPGRFTSNILFGQPGIYPTGPPMAPAASPRVGPREVTAELERLLRACGTAGGLPFDEPALVAAFPDEHLRAAALLLQGTLAAPALTDQLAAGALPVHDYGTPSSPGRIIGLPEGAGPDAALRVVNDRYRHEHFALVAPSLAHDLLHTPVGAGRREEKLLHALLAMVHVQLLAAAPDLGELRSELARRQHSLAITLLNSRRPGDARVRLLAPDGPGTIPGGDPALQSQDFWSIPFGGGDDERAAPPPLRGVLGLLAAPRSAADAPLAFADELARWIDEHHGDDWLPPRAQLRASVALGLLDPDPVLRAWAGLGPV
jgi:hypothetical protein